MKKFTPARVRVPSPKIAPPDQDDPTQLKDRSYLAYFRETPKPFLHLASGHFPPGTETTPHEHKWLALHGCIQGPLTLCTPGGDLTLDAGVFYLVPPGIRHHWRNDGNFTSSTFGLLVNTTETNHWPADTGIRTCLRFLQDQVKDLIRFNTSGDMDLHHSFWFAADYLLSEKPREELCLTGILLTLFGQIKERLSVDLRDEPAVDEVASQIRRLLLNRVRENLNISQISRLIGVSTTRAKNEFRQAFGCGIMSYFNQLKIWQAKRMLDDPELSIEQISDQLGFSNASYFTRVFQKFTAETPTVYRRKYSRKGLNG